MNEKVKPALTAQQWARLWIEVPNVDVVGGVDVLHLSRGRNEITVERPGPWMSSIPKELFHQAAAFALYGQPFGFTREDAETHRALAAREEQAIKRIDIMARGEPAVQRSMGSYEKPGTPMYDRKIARELRRWHLEMALRIDALYEPPRGTVLDKGPE